MFVIANLLSAVAGILNVVLTALYWLVIVRALASWLGPDPFNPLVQFLNASTEWMLAPLRSRMPWSFKLGFDLSPVIAILLLVFMQRFLVVTLIDIAMRIKMAS